MIGIPVLETERLILRAFKSEDFEPMAEFFGNDESYYFGGPFNRADAWHRLAAFTGHWSLRGYGEWALQEKATGRFVGFCGPWYPAEAVEPEIAWALLPDHYGKGYAGEAAKRAIRYVYEDLKWSTVMSLIEPGNTPSVRLAERLGAQAEQTVDIYGREAVIYRHLPPTVFAERYP